MTFLLFLAYEKDIVTLKGWHTIKLRNQTKPNLPYEIFLK